MSGLQEKSSSAIVAVKDAETAKAFYGDILGLTLEAESTSVLTYVTGNTRLIVYPSEFAGTNKANAVVWSCGDEIKTIVADLREKGVKFERYDFEGVTFADGLHSAGDFHMAWFKDPDGNILHLTS